jgi:hypothetical protein
MRRASWASLAFGAALGVSTATLWGIGSRRARSIERGCGESCSEDYVAAQVDHANLHSLERAVHVTGISAAVLLGSSLGLWLWQRQISKPARLSWNVSGVSYSQRF